MKILSRNAPGGYLLRRVLPTTLFLMVTITLLAGWGAGRGFYDQNMVTPVLILVNGSLLLILFWHSAVVLNHEYGVRLEGEAELMKTHDLVQIVSDCTSDAIFVKNHKGRLIFANPAALALLNTDLHAAMGRKSSELFADPAVAAAIEENNRRVLDTGKVHSIEISMRVGDEVKTFLSTTSPWTAKHGGILGTVGIATDITERKQSEDALKAHELQLEALVEARTAEVRELIGHIQTMREEEKRAIARELHDDLGSSLTALNMHLAILFQQIPDDASTTERITQIKALLSSVTATTRRIQNGLRPDKLDIFGIKTAILDQAQDFENYTGVACVASLPDEEVKYSPQVEISLFRMVQEALNNIAKHAKATRVEIILDDDDENIYLTVRDDGVGIGNDAPPYNSTHGLRGMRERAAYLGGQTEIFSNEGGGTRVRITLPRNASVGHARSETKLKKSA